MKKYKVFLVIESDGEAEDDPKVTKIVTAQDKDEALTKARELVREKNPELNDLKIRAWSIEEIS